MSCFHPVPAAYQGSRIRLYPPWGETEFHLPCGGCLGCMQDRSLAWSIRAIHEAALHEDNSFVTLTYDDQHLPRDRNVDPNHLRKFFVDLRNALRKPTPGLRGNKIRYLAAAEYGDQLGRPHYHAIIFGLAVTDGIQLRDQLVKSQALAKVWGKGYVSVGAVTPQSARYVAQYTLKKWGVAGPCDNDGVVRRKPFIRCSLRPGLGAAYLRKYPEDFALGYAVTCDGKKVSIPRYYMKILEAEFPQAHESALAARQDNQRPPDYGQLAARQRVAERNQQRNLTRRKTANAPDALHGL